MREEKEDTQQYIKYLVAGVSAFALALAQEIGIITGTTYKA
ncbi:hypothetical protein [Microcoleus sp. FACHB-831]|nr:hypothetical protein [Microcoleus sp. FACHB-831]